MEKANTSPGSAPGRYGLSTDEFAAQHRVLAQSIRKQLWANGSYFGIVPLRLPNRKLLWPKDSVEKLLEAQNLSEGV
ncbi:DNA-binding protein [Roseateles oligotrophus]|uniref:DNA-binding protein n=1 Tax=Roseateles oligotrophus TaxID=1769250 RepID=A0ABT2YJ37_9BURK|nr:DNA-binding protein [Roseateles oligotrophus]MCV2370017.1 DNA-binding protein [Roseateles oligotrophus]